MAAIANQVLAVLDALGADNGEAQEGVLGHNSRRVLSPPEIEPLSPPTGAITAGQTVCSHSLSMS